MTSMLNQSKCLTQPKNKRDCSSYQSLRDLSSNRRKPGWIPSYFDITSISTKGIFSNYMIKLLLLRIVMITACFIIKKQTLRLLITLEIFIILIIMGMALLGIEIFFILLLICIGACEGAVGLGALIGITRTKTDFDLR